MPAPTFRKAHSAAPPGYFRWEAAGLRWLAAAHDGVPVVRVLRADDRGLDLERLTPGHAGLPAAEELGRRLAATHAAGAPRWGAPPVGWSGDGWYGPLAETLPLGLAPAATWGELVADQRVLPLLAEGRRRGVYDDADARLLERLADRLRDGLAATDDTPARLHGDLWSGNVVWTSGGAVLVDPAAHGGHREADLAMLALFGAPYLERVLAAYDEAVPLADGWRERVTLHQLHPLMLHACVFGGAYVEQSLEVARAWA
ncbi:fructosamine kinase family protein [Lapillicoccus jejuensis]|uniref:Fructosamine-3-kinase n=1 Tax=Lapillicoccus jejuensis TaxID=402171 RepID=A0A542E630_9MICO|nr:fructosamine kinase family protein [Lapillicoccus jejuensis]TQJ10749.1 fructosamine-3-kinase [Lapillicoccus jejuensis]